MSNKKVLVTGGTGYIGSHTVVSLQEAGYEVLIIDNLANSKREVVDRIEKITGSPPRFYKIDLCVKNKLESFFREYPDLDSVIHFAAYKSVGESVQEPVRYYHNNLLSLCNLLEMSEKYNVNRLVFSSSCTVYGEPEEIPVSEAAPVKNAVSPYGNTKQIGEDILRDTSRAKDLQVISLRYFNPIGAHPSALIGEWPLGKPENLLPYLTQTARGRQEVLTVHGADYPTPDGTCIRDYIHVVDVAEAHVVALERLEQQKNRDAFEVFNLGTGKGYSVLEVIRAFEKVTGIRVKYRMGSRREGDVVRVYANTQKANKELEWKARFGLEDMVSSAWAWEKELREMEKV